MASARESAAETGQIVVRVPAALLDRLDSLARREAAADRSSIVREALVRFLEDQNPAAGTPVKAVKPAYQAAVEQAFRDQEQLWTPFSVARFANVHDALAPICKAAVSVWISRPPFAAHPSKPPGIYAGEIQWESQVNSPSELYEALCRHLGGLARRRRSRP